MLIDFLPLDSTSAGDRNATCPVRLRGGEDLFEGDDLDRHERAVIPSTWMDAGATSKAARANMMQPRFVSGCSFCGVRSGHRFVYILSGSHSLYS